MSSDRSKPTLRGSKEPLFRALSTVLLRAPLLPLELYRGLSGDPSRPAGDARAALADPRVRLALLVGSRSLFEALERDRDDQVRSKVLRYLIRMSSRPTPYGMFAGVCLADLDRETDFRLSGEVRKRIRPDMAWLLHLVSALEGIPEVRERLRVVQNPAAYLRAGRFVVAERAALSEPVRAPEVSIRATGGVRRALEIAESPVAYTRLRDDLRTMPGATSDNVDHLLASLLAQTFLLSDLRPPLTGGNPARHVLDRLAGIEPARATLDELRALLEETSAWEALPPEEAIVAYPRLLDRAGGLVPREKVDTPFQVDLFLVPERTRIHRAVGEEVCRAAELLLRLTPIPGGPQGLAAYRQAFLSRYGLDREVPLLELLDGNLGLGAYASTRDPQNDARRERVLMEIAATAQRTLCPCVELDDALLLRLGAGGIDPERAPVSLDVPVFVAARSPEALDAGQFTVVIGPNAGPTSAGRVTGRFAEGLGEAGVGLLRRIAAEEESAEADVIWAELVYLPHRPRAANVSVRPGVRGHEIPVGLHPGLTAAESIPLRELVVGVRGDRLYLRWPRADKEIRACNGHMLNAFLGPEVCRFLSDIGHGGRRMLSRFTWGKAESFPYLPRVRSGRVVLRPAEWKIDYSCRQRFFPEAGHEGFAAELGHFRQTWAVPRHVYLASMDNRLLLDLEDAEQAAELRTEIARLKDGAWIILQEVVPALDELWVRGPAGSFSTELCVSMIRRSRPKEAPATVHPPNGASSPAAGRRDSLFPPGSEWTFLTLHAGPDLHGDLIAGPVRDLARRLLDTGLAGQWFFIRYTDPDHHLRLRFRCAQPDLRPALFSELCAWATALLDQGRCLRFAFDTYDREVERYGGPEAMLLAEQIFEVDASSAVDLLALLQQHREIDPRDLVVATTDNLLLGLGLQGDEAIRWLRGRRGDKRISGPEYRKRGETLRGYLAPREGRSTPPLPPDIRSNLERARERLLPLSAGLDELERRGSLLQPKERLLGYFTHMHFNRLVGPDPGQERLTLALLCRAREAIVHTAGSEAS